MKKYPRNIAPILLAVIWIVASLFGQSGPSAPGDQPIPRPSTPPRVTSPQVNEDRRVTFRLFAPEAKAVNLMAPDIPGNERGSPLTKDDNGIWMVTLGPLEPGAYRYNFAADKTAVIDPRNPSVSESNNTVWSLIYVPGEDFMELKDVPHGGMSSVQYYSKALGKWRRMHVYTPPGYELGQGKYPVLYLIHGGDDSDDSWPTVGRAGFIMDNLVASQKAKPMIVVMPAGQTSRTGGGMAEVHDFVRDFLGDIVPYVDTHYRAYADRAHRAIAGLSLGGLQTLYIAIPQVEKFDYIGIFSSALVDLVPGRAPQGGAAPVAAWEAKHLPELDNHSAQGDLKLLWFKTGVDDHNVSISSSEATVDMLNKHGFKAVFQQSTGGHTWLNWRMYLREFAPQLFQ